MTRRGFSQRRMASNQKPQTLSHETFWYDCRAGYAWLFTEGGGIARIIPAHSLTQSREPNCRLILSVTGKIAMNCGKIAAFPKHAGT
jgi:hypothetical protein